MTIERAAKAIACHHLEQFDVQARAALAAIAEPTPEMIKAGMFPVLEDVLSTRPAKDLVIEVWRAMHAAMMKEKE